MIRRSLALAVLLNWCVDVPAQYLIGGAAGGSFFGPFTSYRDGYDHGSMSSAPGPHWTASVYYREKRARSFNLGFEMIYSRKEFHAAYGTGGHGGGLETDAFVELDLLYFAALPAVYFGPRKRTCLRFGVMGSGILNGTTRGQSTSFSMNTGSTRGDFNETNASDFRGDGRLYLGFGAEFTERGICAVVDPYFSMPITSLLKDNIKMNGIEWGLRLGLAMSMPGITLTEQIRKHRPVQ